MIGFTEFGTGSRTNQVRKLIVFFYNNQSIFMQLVKIPSHYSRQMLVKYTVVFPTSLSKVEKLKIKFART